MTEMRKLSPGEESDLAAARWHWEGAYEITFELTEGGQRFVARYIGNGKPPEQDKVPVSEPDLGRLRSRLRDDYGLRRECRGSGL
jgi:hypothetical protein